MQKCKYGKALIKIKVIFTSQSEQKVNFHFNLLNYMKK